MKHNTNIDKSKLNNLSELTLNYSVGMTISAGIYIGDQLGLYRAMQDNLPITSLKLAEKLAYDERWVREWLHGQVTAGLIEYQESSDTYRLSPEATLILANDSNPYFQAGAFSKILTLPLILRALEKSFKTGIGFDFDLAGEDGALKVEKTFAPWYRSVFLDKVLPSLGDIQTKLSSGIKVADIGCGTGLALIEMAKRFPNSTFYGYEISSFALKLADKNKLLAKVDNVYFEDANLNPLPDDASFSFITAFDCLHDMTKPQEILVSVQKALKQDGIFFVAELKTKDSFIENLNGNPFARHLYSWSLLYCLPSSLSEKEGAGLGTCGLGETKLKEYLSNTNLILYRIHDFDNPLNVYYEIHQMGSSRP